MTSSSFKSLSLSSKRAVNPSSNCFPLKKEPAVYASCSVAVVTDSFNATSFFSTTNIVSPSLIPPSVVIFSFVKSLALFSPCLNVSTAQESFAVVGFVAKTYFPYFPSSVSETNQTRLPSLILL